jgi:hypothetical protein
VAVRILVQICRQFLRRLAFLDGIPERYIERIGERFLFCFLRLPGALARAGERGASSSSISLLAESSLSYGNAGCEGFSGSGSSSS